MNVKDHKNIMPTVDCTGFHNSDAEYQRELAGICDNPSLEYTLSYCLTVVLQLCERKYGVFITQPTCSVLLTAIWFETTQFAVTNLKINVFNPTVERHITFTSILMAWPKDKWNIKTELPTCLNGKMILCFLPTTATKKKPVAKKTTKFTALN